MRLSTKAIKDLRTALQKSYGDDLGAALSDEEVEHIGLVVLTGLVESLNVEISLS